MATGTQYEFTQQQNQEIGDLGGKMRFVGFFSAAFGVITLLICLLTVLFLFRDRLPSGFRQKATDYLQKAQASLPEDLKKQAANYSLDKIPTDNNFLYGVVVFTGVTALIFLLQGGWTRASAVSFQKIVDTKGNDIDILMQAVGSLRAMYGQVYLLLLAALLGGPGLSCAAGGQGVGVGSRGMYVGTVWTSQETVGRSCVTIRFIRTRFTTGRPHSGQSDLPPQKRSPSQGSFRKQYSTCLQA